MDGGRCRTRVLVLSAAMGGGHLQVSRELKRRLELLGYDVMVADMLDLMPGPTGRWLHWVYPWLVNRAPRLYQRVYDTFFVAEQRAGERAAVPVRLALPGLRRLVEEFGPGLAVATYPLCALALGELRRRRELDCRAVTVITTFSVNNLWVHPSVDLEMCIAEQSADDATRRTGRMALVCGPIVAPGFHELAGREAACAQFGVPTGQRMAVVTTGSIGLAGSAASAAQAIAGYDGWVPVVLCGRSDELRERVERIPGAVALDWVDDMPNLMAAADVLVDNNCGMSSKEALGIGLPVVTFRPINGHGRDDAAALERLGLTDVVETEQDLLRTITALVDDHELRADRVKRGRNLFVADAAAMLEQELRRAAHIPRAEPAPPATSPLDSGVPSHDSWTVLPPATSTTPGPRRPRVPDH